MGSADRYKYRVLDVCQTLHETRTGGTSEPMDDEHRQELRRWLLSRIENWQPSVPEFKRYDEAVHHLVRIALEIP